MFDAPAAETLTVQVVDPAAMSATSVRGNGFVPDRKYPPTPRVESPPEPSIVEELAVMGSVGIVVKVIAPEKAHFMVVRQRLLATLNRPVSVEFDADMPVGV